MWIVSDGASSETFLKQKLSDQLTRRSLMSSCRRAPSCSRGSGSARCGSMVPLSSVFSTPACSAVSLHNSESDSDPVRVYLSSSMKRSSAARLASMVTDRKRGSSRCSAADRSRRSSRTGTRSGSSGEPRSATRWDPRVREERTERSSRRAFMTEPDTSCPPPHTHTPNRNRVRITTAESQNASETEPNLNVSLNLKTCEIFKIKVLF